MNLRQALKVRGISQKFLCLSLGLSQTSISFQVNGKRNISMKKRQQMAVLMGLSFEEFTKMAESKKDRLCSYDFKQQYFATCEKCQRTHSVRTQEDRDPEYYTRIYVECSCGDWVKFNLPVN